MSLTQKNIIMFDVTTMVLIPKAIKNCEKALTIFLCGPVVLDRWMSHSFNFDYIALFFLEVGNQMLAFV